MVGSKATVGIIDDSNSKSLIRRDKQGLLWNSSTSTLIFGWFARAVCKSFRVINYGASGEYSDRPGECGSPAAVGVGKIMCNFLVQCHDTS